MTAAQLFCKYVNLSLMLTDSLYWLGIYQIELDGLHDWSMCSLILQVVRCDVSGVYLISVSGGYWLTAVNISQHNLNHLSHTSVEDGRLKNNICINNKQRRYILYFHKSMENNRSWSTRWSWETVRMDGWHEYHSSNRFNAFSHRCSSVIWGLIRLNQWEKIELKSSPE